VIVGSAMEVVGVNGAVVSVTVSPVLTGVVDTGPGGAGVGSAELVSLKATDTAPMASTAPAPTVADTSFTLVDFTSAQLQFDLNSKSGGVNTTPPLNE
jgi:hypothetical protein